jgi:hypothetical protein
MSPDQIREKLPPKLEGPRIEADSPHVRVELICVCGRALESVNYIDHSNTVKMVVAPCPCYQFGKVKK